MLMKLFRSILWISPLLFGLGACSTHKVALGGRCSATSDCSSGNFCVTGVCSAGAAGGTGSSGGGVGAGTPSIDSVAVAEGVFTIKGVNLTGATNVQVTGGTPAIDASLSVSGVTAGQLTATATAAVNFISGQVYSFVVATASAGPSAPAIVTFTPANGSVTGQMLSTANCSDKQVMTYSAAAGWGCASVGGGAARNIQIPLTSVYPQSVFYSGSTMGVDLSVLGAEANFAFTIPADYDGSSNVMLSLLSWADDAPCSSGLSFLGTYYRAGKGPDSGPSFASDVAKVNYVGAEVSVASTYVLPPSAVFPSLLAGDSVVFTIQSATPPSGTTCSEGPRIVGLFVSYTGM